MKKICIGILAHVDAGKTTLSEALLYNYGSIRKLGRVDHRDTFFDNNTIERKRGITVFSKTAVIQTGNTVVTIIDTPGHVDFSAEMERSLYVMDAAILVISGAAGVQGHTETLAHLLKRADIPVFIFVNKMDMPFVDKNVIMTSLQRIFNNSCVEFGRRDDSFFESIAMSDEGLLERYLNGIKADDDDIEQLINSRRIFPVFYGSALKNVNVSELMEAVISYTSEPLPLPSQAARVFKILYDDKGNRLTYMKVTGGSFSTKESIQTEAGSDSKEKIDQIRVYSGDKMSLKDTATSGDVVACTGLFKTYPGQGLGAEPSSDNQVSSSVFSYRVLFDESIESSRVVKAFRMLEEEDPSLHVYWNDRNKELHVNLMGEIQLEIIKNVVKSRFGFDIDFGTGTVLYKETIKEPVVGVGHYEPLRHYGEVHLLIEPAKRGTGISYKSIVSTDELDISYQKQIMNSLQSKVHLGVLTGSPITDVSITLIAGKAHLKHTEGGDLRESALRAVRNGLMYSKSILLEPYYEFKIDIPSQHIGRLMTDLKGIFALAEGPELYGDRAVITGSAPVATLHEYQKEFIKLTSGKGRITYSFKGYDVCHNEEEVLGDSFYIPEADLDNSPDSVFCSHGAGELVAWNEVHRRAHVRNEHYRHLYDINNSYDEETASSVADRQYSTDDLDEIFYRTYGISKREKYRYNIERKEIAAPQKEALKQYAPRDKSQTRESLLIVDGFNIIYAWKELREMLDVNIDAAIAALVDIMINYHGYTGRKMLIVFDAYRIKGRKATRFEKNEPIQVIFTGEAESADMYIEKFVYDNNSKYAITVATSDGLEQLHVMSKGAVRMSASEFMEEVLRINKQIREHIE